jgi:hypothetical protein
LVLVEFGTGVILEHLDGGFFFADEDADCNL